MKKLSAFLSATFLLWSFQSSAADIDSSDPCAVTLCMYGEATGTADSQCKAAIAKFFSIQVFDARGVFMPWKTKNARSHFLAGCRFADASSVNQILNQYGTAK